MFISLSDPSVNLSLDPTINNGYATTTFKINVGTNNPTGYHLFLNADGSNNALVNTSDNTVTIDALPNNNTNNTGYNESNFPSNTWGYNSNGSSWSFVGSTNYFPLSNTATEIDSSTTNTNNKETTISLAAKVDYSKPSGSYTKDLIISILPTISTYELNYNANTTETVTNLPLPLVMNHWANIAPAIPINTTSIPSRDGYNFKGYTAIQNGNTAEYTYNSDTNTFTPATFTPASATALSDTLYAVWEVAASTITWNANGGTVSPTSTVVPNGSQIGTLPTPTYDGYVFKGWFTAVEGGTEITASTIPTSSTTYYARWRKIISFSMSSRTVPKTTYQAEEGMTFEEFEGSIYNIDNKFSFGGGVGWGGWECFGISMKHVIQDNESISCRDPA